VKKGIVFVKGLMTNTDKALISLQGIAVKQLANKSGLFTVRGKTGIGQRDIIDVVSVERTETRRVSIKMLRKGILNSANRGLVGRDKSLRRDFGLVLLMAGRRRNLGTSYSLINSSGI
jgi:hypothetical protein